MLSTTTTYRLSKWVEASHVQPSKCSTPRPRKIFFSHLSCFLHACNFSIPTSFFYGVYWIIYGSIQTRRQKCHLSPRHSMKKLGDTIIRSYNNMYRYLKIPPLPNSTRLQPVKPIEDMLKEKKRNYIRCDAMRCEGV